MSCFCGGLAEGDRNSSGISFPVEVEIGTFRATGLKVETRRSNAPAKAVDL